MKNIQILSALLLLSGATQIFSTEDLAVIWHTRAIDFLIQRDCVPLSVPSDENHGYEKCKTHKLYKQAFLNNKHESPYEKEKALEIYMRTFNRTPNDLNPNYSNEHMRSVFLKEREIFLDAAIKIATSKEKTAVVSSLNGLKQATGTARNDEELGKIFEDANDCLKKNGLFAEVCYS